MCADDKVHHQESTGTAPVPYLRLAANHDKPTIYHNAIADLLVLLSNISRESRCHFESAASVLGLR